MRSPDSALAVQERVTVGIGRGPSYFASAMAIPALLLSPLQGSQPVGIVATRPIYGAVSREGATLDRDLEALRVVVQQATPEAEIVKDPVFALERNVTRRVRARLVRRDRHLPMAESPDELHRMLERRV